MTVIALIPTGSGLSKKPCKTDVAPGWPLIRSIRKSVSRTAVSRHPARLGLHALPEPLPEISLRRPQVAGGLLVQDAHELEQGELPRKPVDYVAETLTVPFQGMEPGVCALREIDRLRRHHLCMCVYGP